MEFDLTVLTSNAGALASGLWLTLAITAMALVGGMAIGLPVCLCRMRERGVANRLARSYITFFRITPELMLIFWTYFCLPAVVDLRISGVASGTLALALVCGAYMAEIYRAGIEAVPRG